MTDLSRNRRLLIVKYVFCVFLIAIALSVVDLATLLSELSSLKMYWVALAFGMTVLAVIVASWQLCFTFQSFGTELPVLKMIVVSYISTFYSTFLPFGLVAGGVATTLKVSKITGALAQAGSVVAVLRVMNVIPLFVFAILGLSLDPVLSRHFGSNQSMLVLLVLFATITLLLIRAPAFRNLGLHLIARVDPKGEVAVFLQSLGKWQLLVHSLFALTAFSIIVVAWWALIHAVGFVLDFSTLVWLSSFLALVSFLPFTINGLGAREVSLIAILGLYGVDGAQAMALSVVFVALTTFNALIGGVLELTYRSD